MNHNVLRAIALGAIAAAVLDALDAIVAYRLAFGLDPVKIYQFVASGLLGPAAYEGGAASALLGLLVHCGVALGAATAFTLLARRHAILYERPLAAGAVHGLAVFAFMNVLVIPLSRIPPAPMTLPLLLNGLLGHVFLVGIPIALAARRAFTEPRLVPARP